MQMQKRLFKMNIFFQNTALQGDIKESKHLSELDDSNCVIYIFWFETSNGLQGLWSQTNIHTPIEIFAIQEIRINSVYYTKCKYFGITTFLIYAKTYYKLTDSDYNYYDSNVQDRLLLFLNTIEIVFFCGKNRNDVQVYKFITPSYSSNQK